MKSNLSPAASPIGQKKTAKNFFMQYAIYLVLFCIIIVIVALDPSFLSMRNITNILQQAATKLIKSDSIRINPVERYVNNAFYNYLTGTDYE